MKLSVKKREILGKKVSTLRRQGLIPAVVYGKHCDATSIACLKNDLLKVYRTAWYTTPVELTGDLDQLALIYNLQLNPISDEIIAADFLAVSKTEKVKANIPVVLKGESPLEKLNEWRVQLVRNTVQVESFPQDLPSQIEIDLATITSIEQVVFVRDLNLGDKVTIMDDANLPVVTVVSLDEDDEQTSTEEAAATTTTTD